MTERERVVAALTHASPDRALRDIWPLPGIYLFRQAELDALEGEFPMDMCWCSLVPDEDNKGIEHLRQSGKYTDDWDCVWQVGEPGVVGEVCQPALVDWSALPRFEPPWRLLRNRDFSYANHFCDASRRFVLSGLTAQPFERMQYLRGSENLYIDLAYGTAEVRKLLEIVHEYFLAEIEGWCRSNVDGVFFQDDWGSNRSLLISPAQWRDLFKPLYQDYCKRIHAAGKFAMFHSDGHIAAIFDDLVEIGVDAINTQLFCMDITRLAEKYKDKITFWGEIDRQRLLAFGSAAEIREGVRQVRRALDDGMGGVIAQCCWGLDNSLEKIATVYRTWLEPREGGE